jgi:deazaflavin-dependent oxidoreductase (nitroreductase family)
MANPDAARWRRMNEPVIRRFRASGGIDSGRQFPVILLTTTGRQTGKPHITPLNFTLDGDRIIVIASSGGAAAHPDWYLNLVADPEVTIEHGPDTFRARAVTVDEPERTRLYDLQASAMPFFNGYRTRVTTRQIPVVAFERTDPA